MAEKKETPQNKLLRDFKSARKVAVPLVIIETSDPAATIRTIRDGLLKTNPMFVWDIVGGIAPVNDVAADILPQVVDDRDPKMLNNPAELLDLIKPEDRLPKSGILFFHNIHRFIGSDSVAEAAVGQAIWNLRDRFKANKRTFVGLCPIAAVPAELRNDVLVLEDPLPDTEELEDVIKTIHKNASLDFPNKSILDKAIETVRGLSAFAAEQATAMSLTETGLDLQFLWERKRKQIEQTPGLSVYKAKETFNDVRGVPVIKEFLSNLMTGNRPPTVLVFMDEIEKMFAGVMGDLSGTSQEQHGEFLRWMQDLEVLGITFVGHPGCSKSLISKATAGQFGVPMIELNMTALKGSLVGQTGAQTREALKTISAMGRPLVLATSNSLAILPPELKRRFQLGTWFFDLPNQTERQAVWDLYIQKYKINNFSTLPNTDGWTPAEIKTCCDIAWRLKINPVEASKFVVPISKSDPEKIEALRKQANNRFNSVNQPGAYKYAAIKAMEDNIRAINVSDKSVN